MSEECRRGGVCDHNNPGVALVNAAPVERSSPSSPGSGALIETMLFGFLLVSRGSPADLIFHAILCAVILLLLAWIARGLHTSKVSKEVKESRDSG
jgi:hypothetical protein